MTHTGTYGDLRFIFELCYKYEDIYKDAPLKERKLLSIMINEIYNSISFTRNETILNIEKKMILISLKRFFKPILWKTTEVKWVYLIDD